MRRQGNNRNENMGRNPSRQNRERRSTSRTSHRRQGPRRCDNGRRSRREVARAPYNFVSLNTSVVEGQPLPDLDKYHEDRFTGHVDLEIETITPLFIRQVKENTNFFSINENEPIIPGSSIRGMIRTLIEIVTYGKFHAFNDRRLYHRGLADVPPLRTLYRQRLQNVNAGYLIWDEYKQQYYIKPTEYTTFYDNTSKEFYIERDNNKYKVWTGRMKNKKRQWIFFDPNENTDSIKVPENVIEDYIQDKNRTLPRHYDILKMAREKKIRNPNGTEVELPHGAPVFYVTDENSNDDPVVVAIGHTKNFRVPYDLKMSHHVRSNLLDPSLTDFTDAIFGTTFHASRVFFEDARLLEKRADVFHEEVVLKVLSEPKPTTFQHYLEQPNGKNTSERELKHWDDEDALIRGYKLYWHRKLLDDGGPRSWYENKFEINEENFKNFLDSSNITTSALLSSDETIHEVNDGKIFVKKTFSKLPREIQDEIRAYHAWKESKFQYQIVRPIKEGVKFHSKIHFENLTPEELGALLFVLRLPDGCRHKLGLGKPLGLGSIKITLKLLRIDRNKRYERLFNDQGYWQLAECEERNIDKFIQSFENYVLDKLSHDERNGANSLWDTPRLKKLRILLNYDWNHEATTWIKKTRYLEIECDPRRTDCICSPSRRRNTCNEFKNRPVLPTPKEVVKND